MGRIVMCALALMGAGLFPGLAAAEGALAIGVTGDVARDGFAYGIIFNRSSAAEARESALNSCKTAPGNASQQLRSKCRIIGEFGRGQCASVAWDPDDGTPGAGWAIGSSRESAERDAMAMCRNTAGKRADKCVIGNTRCEDR